MWLAGGLILVSCAPAVEPVPDRFNYIVGTQTFSPAYQFTEQTKLVETAEAIARLGSNAIKFRLANDYATRGDIPVGAKKIESLTELAQEASIKRVFEMPFAYYLLWVSPFRGADWKKDYSPEKQAREYDEVYELTCHLLKTYRGTHKVFYLGHWEGDWLLRGSFGDTSGVTTERITGMIAWLNVRQKAIDAAKRDTPHEAVDVWHYTEVNRVVDAMHGLHSVTNDVLPKSNVDFVSYSAYDSQRGDLTKSLNYIESKLPEKKGIQGKRVFIGEYGFPAARHTPAEQERLSRAVMRAGVDWGCPFVLYWEMYNNEVKDGKQVGFWLIDDHNVKQPIYETHQRFYRWSRDFVSQWTKQHPGQTLPSEEYRHAAVEFLDKMPAVVGR